MDPPDSSTHTCTSSRSRGSSSRRSSAQHHAPMRYLSFQEFYPFYLSQHRHPGTRLLHALGTCLALLTGIVALAVRRPVLLLAAPLLGYGPAWLSHAVLERNRPATFRYPLWSLLADCRMLADLFTGRERLSGEYGASYGVVRS